MGSSPAQVHQCHFPGSGLALTFSGVERLRACLLGVAVRLALLAITGEDEQRAGDHHPDPDHRGHVGDEYPGRQLQGDEVDQPSADDDGEAASSAKGSAAAPASQRRRAGSRPHRKYPLAPARAGSRLERSCRPVQIAGCPIRWRFRRRSLALLGTNTPGVGYSVTSRYRAEAAPAASAPLLSRSGSERACRAKPSPTAKR